jgi:hypothetical protein
MINERGKGEYQRFEGAASMTLADPNDPAQLENAFKTVFPHAVTEAILKAKNELHTDLVSWTFATLLGQVGGFTQIYEIRVAIDGKVGPLEAEQGREFVH